MTAAVVIRPTESWRDRRHFQRLPWLIYAGRGHRDPHWVPPLVTQERQLLGWAHHPFYENADSVTWLAERGGRVVGRLMVIVNHIHNRKYDEQLGFFAFFECVDDAAAARALFDTGDAWLRQRGMTAVRGPVSPSLNYMCGLLVDGFDRPPCFLMPYNPPYYAALLESCGFAKSHDLYAYEMDVALLAKLTQRYKPAVLAALAHTNLVLRPFDSSGGRAFQRDIETYLDIYNRALDGTWGFTPLQPREARHIADELRRVIVPQFAVFAEIDGQPVGALLGLLDYNQILRKLNGRLWPFGFVRLWAGRRRITTARVMAMTMVPGYQNAGLSVVLLDCMAVAAAKWGIERYELSWVLETNTRSRGTLERAGTRITSTYRIYEKAL
jgi:GNAT superfamily N-acetyltransferase